MSTFTVENINGVNTVVSSNLTSASVESLKDKHPESDIRKGEAGIGHVEVDGVFVAPEPLAADLVAALHRGATLHQDTYPTGKADALIMSNANAGKPKSAANVLWLKGLWGEYYTRVDALSTDTDFSNIGPMPYTVRECVEE